MSVFVGLDCGGSSSRIMAVDTSGEILYQGHSGAANLVTTPETRLKRNLQHASKGCPQPQFACGCFAGLISDQVRMRGLSHLRDLFPNAQLRAEPDYTAAYYASPAGTDICVISGTGSLVCSKKDGQIVKSGGRGYILGDEGSSFQFGRDAVMFYLRHPSESSPILIEAILESFGSLDPSEIIAATYRSGTPATLLGKFARTLGQDAQAQRPYAVKSLSSHLSVLGAVVSEHYSTYLEGRTKEFTVTLAGGLWKASPIFKETFTQILRNALPVQTLIVHRILRPPLHGAVELAREMVIGN
jgi:glucosamine kinase